MNMTLAKMIENKWKSSSGIELAGANSFWQCRRPLLEDVHLKVFNSCFTQVFLIWKFTTQDKLLKPTVGWRLYRKLNPGSFLPWMYPRTSCKCSENRKSHERWRPESNCMDINDHKSWFNKLWSVKMERFLEQVIFWVLVICILYLQ